MSQPRAASLIKSVEDLMAEKKAVVEKEKGFIDALNRVLTEMGYTLVPIPRRLAAGRSERSRGAAGQAPAKRRAKRTRARTRAAAPDARARGARASRRRRKGRRVRG